jgi:hypothetical protein
VEEQKRRKRIPGAPEVQVQLVFNRNLDYLSHLEAAVEEAE